MQRRLQPRRGRASANRRIAIKTILFVLSFFLVIFLLDKIEMSVPSKLIKQEIRNDKIITLK